MGDLGKAIETLTAKADSYARWWRYYDGDHPVVYTARRLEQIFKAVDAKFSENWCAVVVDSALERIQLKGLKTPENPGAQAALSGLWMANSLGLESDDAHQCALVTSEAYLIVWPEDGQVECYYNDSRMCHLFYDAERPRVKRFAAKWWNDDDGLRRVTLYYPDRLEYYKSRQAAKETSIFEEGSFEKAADPAKNGFGEVPVFHLRMSRRGTNELTNAIPPQNGINKLLIDMMVAAEYGAFKQRYVISQGEVKGQLQNAPNMIWEVPAGDGLGQGTQVGEFGANDLRNYFEAIDRLAMAVGIITRTPKHFFYQQSGDPSGEALIALEGPLNKKCEARIERFTPTWRDAARFMLKLSGVDVDPAAIAVEFEQPQTVQPLTRAQARNFDVSSGMPLRTVLRREGWDENELGQLDADRETDAAASQEGLAAALAEAERRFNAG